jgi:probable F420-dependent oxidoreductase
VNLVNGFRFGVNMVAPASRSEWVDKCRKVEDRGYDVICVADHLEMPSPFPALTLAAEVTERPKLCPYVLNAPFYNPTLLARDVLTTKQLTDGRLELGIGAGYVKAEFEKAGIPWQSGGRRIDQLERTLDELDSLDLPLLIGGWGDRTLRLAAARADTISFTGAAVDREGKVRGLANLAGLTERVEFVRAALGEREVEVELNVLVQLVAITDDRAGLLEKFQPYGPDLSVEELGEVPTLLVGTPEQIAEQLREHREKLGLTYITVLENSLDTFGPVIELLR